MVHTITASNVNHAFVEGLWWLKVNGQLEDSRNGQVLVCPDPVVTKYLHPDRRVLFDKVRDCNPFFHLFESVWMLAGGISVEPLLQFNKRMSDFAETDGTIHGAYGHRWAHHFGRNQLLQIASMLKLNPNDRQAVLSMWDPRADLGVRVKDRPCNTHCYFRVNNGRLDMTVCCRSNDVIWGAYGANAVHFSIMQEFMANAIGIPLGHMFQFSNNFHIYTGVPRYEEMMRHPHLAEDPYSVWRGAHSLPYVVCPDEDPMDFLEDCRRVVAGDYLRVTNRWLKNLVIPMIRLWETRDSQWLRFMLDCDWKIAFIQWLDRRSAK